MPCADPAAMAAAQASATTATMGGHGRREDEGAEGRPRQIRHALHGSGRHGRRAGLRHRRRYGRGREEGGGRGRREDWAEGQPPLPLEGAGRGRRTGRRAGAAAMGGRGRRNGNGEEGGAPREGGLWADARGTRKKIPEREGGENEKNRWRTHHRRVILQSSSDAYVSPPVCNTTRQ